MLRNNLHIISFDVPFPPDYGGVIDVFHKIRKLSEQGIRIYLHCFRYGRAEAEELSRYCEKVWYYPRKTGWRSISFSRPYMQYSRRDPALLNNLLSVDAPILFEGIHCCHLLSAPELTNRVKWVRNHNIEQHYFRLLAQREHSFYKRCYYRMEACLLQKAERELEAAQGFFCISETDRAFIQRLYPNHPVYHIPGFHPYDTICSLPGQGNYCLYHGNLGHPENIEAALFLIEKVFAYTSEKLILAGKNPADKLYTAAAGHKHIEIIADPDEKSMQNLIAHAQIQVLPTFQSSGLKLKLLYALFAGRHVIANKAMLDGTGLEEACTICSDAPESFIQAIGKLMSKNFEEEDLSKRETLLHAFCNNEKNTRIMIEAWQA